MDDGIDHPSTYSGLGQRRDLRRLCAGIDPGEAFFALAEPAHVARVAADAPPAIVAVNEALLAHLGCAPDAVLGRAPSALLGAAGADDRYRAAAAGAAVPTDAKLALTAMGGSEPGLVLGVLRSRADLEAALSALEESEARYRTVVESLAEGVVLFDSSGVVVARNGAAEAMLAGWREADGLGDDRWPVVRESGEALAPEDQPVSVTRRTGRPHDDVVLGVPDPVGDVRWLAVSTRAIRTPGDEPPYRVVASLDDVTDARAAATALRERAASAEQASRRSDALVDALFAQSGVGLAVLDRDLRFQRVNDALAEMTGRPAAAHVGRRLDEVLHHAASAMVSAARQVLATGVAARNVKSAEAPADDATDVRHWETTWSAVRDEDGEIVALSAVVLDTTARERDEVRHRRLEDVTAALAEAGPPDEVGRVIVRHGVRALGGSAGSVTLLARDGEGLDVVWHEGYPPELLARYETVSLAAHLPASEAIRSRRPVFLASEETLRARYPGLGDTPRPGTFRAWASIPLIAHGRVLGALGLSFAEPQDFDLSLRTVLRALADQCALALDRSLAYDRERSAVRLLSQSLLPESLPAIPGVELAARYEPAAQSEVGGDLYDAFATGGGAWLLVVGDVCGKGAAAAALTALVRYTLRAEALHDPHPARLLGLLNRAVAAQRSDDRFCTVACALVRPQPGGHVTATVASGGHPLPLALRGDGSVEELGRAGPLLGVLEVVAPPETTVDLHPGDVLFLCTDGLREAAAPEQLLAASDVARLLMRAGHLEVDALAAHVHAGAIAGVRGPARDDVAILAAAVVPGLAHRPPEAPAHQRSVRLWLEPEPRSASIARAAMNRLEGVRGGVLESARLAVTELVDNAVLHAGLRSGELVEVHAERMGSGVAVEVTDRGCGFDPAHLSRPPAAEGGRGLRLVAALSARWGVERNDGVTRVWCEIAAERATPSAAPARPAPRAP
jgi:PAS domain S-box-containing protein